MGIVRPHWLKWSLAVILAFLLLSCSPLPVVDFSASDTSGSAPLAVQFTDISTGDPTSWSWDFGDGSASTDQSPDHEYTIAGTYQVTLVATRGTDTSQEPGALTITVEPGPLDHVEVSPNPATLTVQAEQAFSVRAFDAFGNELLSLGTQWKAEPEAGTVNQQGSFRASATAGDYPASVVVEVVDGAVTRQATALVTVLPGALDKVEVGAKSVTLSAGESQQFVALAYDRFGNQIPEVGLRWRVAIEAGAISPTGGFSATTAGEYVDAISVEATQGDVTKTDHATITVLPGAPSRVEVTPSRIFLSPQASQQLAATVFDQFGNEIPDPVLEWEVARGGGNIFAFGFLTAGTGAGDYDVTVTAGIAGEQAEVRGVASLTIEPGVLDRTELAPRPATVGAGATHRFAATAYDQFDNEIADFPFRWHARDEAGKIDSAGVFTASTKAGMHADAIVVEAIEGSISKVNRLTVAIEPGPPTHIEVQPSSPSEKHGWRVLGGMMGPVQ